MTPTTLAAVADLYAARGGEHYGEDVTQVEHAVQSALAAMAHDATPALVAAALLHDIGHLLGDGSDVDVHAEAGAAVLDALFGPAVATPVALHVAAKRYLCVTEPVYWSTLSHASQQSLCHQGGPFDVAAAARFIALPYAAEAVMLRRCDDRGKRDWTSGRTFTDFMPLLVGLAGSAVG